MVRHGRVSADFWKTLRVVCVAPGPWRHWEWHAWLGGCRQLLDVLDLYL